MNLRTAYCLCLLALGGCFLTGYEERPLPPIDQPREAGPHDDAGMAPEAGAEPFDMDAAALPDLDARVDTMLDAELEPVTDASDDLGSIEAYCRTRPCGTIKQCDDPASCTLGCGPLDRAYDEVDAGRRDVDCTLDCSGSSTCETSCSPSLRCQTACSEADSCRTSCGVGASCDVYCGGSHCKAECESGSRCAFDCRNGGCDQIVCRAGASCLLRCGASGETDETSCSFAVCEVGQPQRCNNGRSVVCGRACPTR